MLPITACTIRPATEADSDALRHLAALDSRPRLRGPIVVAEIDGEPVAAISLEDHALIADPFRHTANAVALLYARAAAYAATQRAPQLRDRLRAGVRVGLRPAAAA